MFHGHTAGPPHWMAYMAMVVPGFFVLGDVSSAQDAESAFRGKQITMIVGSGVGGGYDVYARAFARHASKHIPGRPVLITKNVPAAGGMVAANTLFNSSDRDGLTIGALANSAGLDPLLGSEGVRFDALKFNWIGSIGKLQSVCAVWHESPIKDIKMAQTQEVIVAGAGATTNTVIVPNILNRLLDTRFKVIPGYEPGSGLTIAVESRETEGLCGMGWSTLKAARPEWIANKRINIILQLAFGKLSDLPHVPSALDLINDPDKREILELILLRQEMGRPFAAPPGVPAYRVEALRRGFDGTMQDSEFISEATRMNLDIDPLSGSEIETLLAKAHLAPERIIKEASELLLPAAARRPK